MQRHLNDRFFIITGGPGSGKTTLINALQSAGFHVVHEAGRQIIKEEIAAGGPALPWEDRALFASSMLARDIACYLEQPDVGLVFFDRGIPDVIGYRTLIGLPVSDAVREAAANYRYNRRVFIAPPWPEIFKQDTERKQTPDEAERTYRAMVETYATLDYELVEIPRMPVEGRVKFIRDRAG